MKTEEIKVGDYVKVFHWRNWVWAGVPMLVRGIDQHGVRVIHPQKGYGGFNLNEVFIVRDPCDFEISRKVVL